MESTFAPPPATDFSPGPDALTPEPAPAAAADTISVIPAQIAEQITIGPVAAWVIERPLDDAARQHKGSNPVLLLDGQHDAGRQESYVRRVTRLDTISAVHQASQWRLDFDPATQRITIHSLLVRRGDHSVDNAQPDRLRVLQRESGLESLILHGRLTIVVILEDVRAGDILDASYTVHSQERIFPEHFCRLTSVLSCALRDFHWRVCFPTGRAMRWKSNDPKLTPAIREEQGATEWSWHLENLPGSEPEPNVPGWHFENPWIQVADFASWAEVASGLVAAWPEELQHPEVLRLIASITSEAATPALRAERVLTFLQDEIRYLSVDTELGGQIPASPGVVLKRGFGDCKDKSFLAAHLLRLLGIPTRPVLVDTELHQSVGDYLPMPGAFNHVIVEYEVDGRRRWIDVTLPYQGGSVLSRPTAQFKLGLPLGPGVEDLEPIPSDESNDGLELRETFFLDTSGRASSLRVQVTATGREAEKWRRSLAHDGVEAFARQRELFYQQLFAGTQRVGKLEWQDDRAHNELVLAEAFDLRDVLFPTPDGKFFLFRFRAHAIQSVLGFFESGKRRHPWEMRFPCRIRHIIEMDSSGLSQNLGRNAHVEAKAFRFSCHLEQRSGMSSVTYRVQVLADHVPAKEFEEHKEKVREVWPLTIVMGQLPRGSTVPWRNRAPENLLPRRIPRAAPPSLAQPSGTAEPGSRAATDPAPVPSGEVAPPLASRASLEKGSVVPRRDKLAPARFPAAVLERGDVKRPNPLPPPRPSGPPPLPTAPPPLDRSMLSRGPRRPRSQRRQRRQRQHLYFLIAIAIGTALLLFMVYFLLS
ncbi:MAG: DUF3857 domain-containing transglutaminase family protein [Chthoniobacter sp.]|uniref:DUF3857 domain-containing transglutaminase family protein n=1 Tax=Chthoniobacter sp. TaxID=2510640 RepID=UPI0032A92189